MLKVPEIPSLKFTTQTSGQNIDDVIKRAIKFHAKLMIILHTTKYFMLKNLNTINLFIVTYNLILKSPAKITI